MVPATKLTVRYRGYGVTKMYDKIVLVKSTPKGLEIKHTGCDFLHEFKEKCNFHTPGKKQKAQAKR